MQNRYALSSLSGTRTALLLRVPSVIVGENFAAGRIRRHSEHANFSLVVEQRRSPGLNDDVDVDEGWCWKYMAGRNPFTNGIEDAFSANLVGAEITVLLLPPSLPPTPPHFETEETATLNFASGQLENPSGSL
ncbi:aminoacyl-tRNA hydrolase [Ascosphaera pollenicola]|nr:aminoacyl-tRNA hydrolase [Ascosphaera pollenicola]